MNIAYVILAHKYPNHLLRLVERLHYKNTTFFIHIDSKVDVEIFKSPFVGRDVRVEFISERANGRWGDIGIVKGTLNALKEVTNNAIKFDRVVLLSGMDYPIKSAREIFQFYVDHPDKDYITYQSFPVEELNYGGLDRIEHYSINFLNKRYTYLPWAYCKNLNFKGRLLNLMLGSLQTIAPKRKFPNHLKPFYGSQWWNLTGKSVELILEYLDNHPEYLNYHTYSLLPDEMFFQSILLNLKLSNEIINDNLRYIQWDDSGSHPEFIDLDRLEELKKSQALFARKFIEGSAILDRIDDYICI